MDDIFCIHHDPDTVLNKLNGNMLLKPGSVRSPYIYLGTKLKFMQWHNCIWAWSMNPSKHVKKELRIFEEYIAKQLRKGYKLPKRAENPFECGYCPELNTPGIWTRWGILLPVLNWNNEVDDWDSTYQYKYQSVPIIITFSNSNTGVLGGSIAYHGLPKAQA